MGGILFFSFFFTVVTENLTLSLRSSSTTFDITSKLRRQPCSNTEHTETHGKGTPRRQAHTFDTKANLFSTLWVLTKPMLQTETTRGLDANRVDSSWSHLIYTSVEVFDTWLHWIGSWVWFRAQVWVGRRIWLSPLMWLNGNYGDHPNLAFYLPDQ